MVKTPSSNIGVVLSDVHVLPRSVDLTIVALGELGACELPGHAGDLRDADVAPVVGAAEADAVAVAGVVTRGGGSDRRAWIDVDGGEERAVGRGRPCALLCGGDHGDGSGHGERRGEI